MENNIQLKVMRCPTCGDKLKYSKVGETVVCMSCGNTVVICDDRKEEQHTIQNDTTSTIMKIDGIKTSSSALAFIEQFLDSYDWEAFTFDPEFTIEELDRVVDNLKATSADDKKTWIAALTCLVVPFAKKIEYRSIILDDIVREFKNDNLDSYGMYDAYKKVASAIVNEYPTIQAKALKIIEYAKKYGASEGELKALNEMLNNIDVAKIKKTIFASIEDIPAIKDYKAEQQKAIIEKLQENGVDAECVYQQALKDKDDKKYKESLDELLSVYGYKDSKTIIDEMERGFNFSNVISIKNQLYFLNKTDDSALYNLYEIKDAKIGENAIVKSISKIVALYANSIYYFGNNNRLYSYDFDTHTDIKLGENYSMDNFYFDLLSQSLFVFKENSKSYDSKSYEFIKINLKDNKATSCIKGIDKVLRFDNFEFLSYKYEKEKQKITAVYVVSENKAYDITKNNVFICGYIDKHIIYTIKTPDNYNKNLYSKELADNTKSILLEANITEDCKIVDGNIYYFTIDNLDKKYLITIDVDGKNRKELAPYIKDVLFVSGDWIYFIKAYRYNTALCKVRKDGSKTSVIASQISKFIRIEAGYLYYIDDVSDLHKVRMDGSRNKIIAHLVEKVLSIKEDKVIYIAKDKLIKDSSYDFNGSEVSSKQYNNSIYVIEFSDTGRRKACYDIVDGSCFDKEKVYYTKYKKIKSDYEEKNRLFLYSLNIDNYETKELVELRVPEKAGCYVATCVYGSYDCPQVWTLRRYRDYKLAKTWLGRAFIHTYYAVSPTLVRWFGKTKWFKQLWKGKLDKMVSKLQEQGFKDTPYEDKNW